MVLWLCGLSFAGVLGSDALMAQDGATQDGAAQGAPTQNGTTQNLPIADNGIRTLHVYANLIQIPVLVLGPTMDFVAPIPASKFKVSIDGGTPYRVTHVRLEGDDPISLAIFLDMHGPEDELMPKIREAIAGLAPLSLHPRDHVSIYALDCGLVRSANDVVADHAVLASSVDEILQAWTDRKRAKHKEDCKDSRHLWDAMAFVTRELAGVPGRRVMLAVTDGDDRGSVSKWNELRFFAQASGVAIFGLAYEPSYSANLHSTGFENELDEVCELSGGMVMTANPGDLTQKLVQFTKMLRGRYIVEFPRPFNATTGEHNLIITVEKSNDFIRPAGASVPIADPALLADPSTVPSDPTLTPEQGKRRVLAKP